MVCCTSIKHLKCIHVGVHRLAQQAKKISCHAYYHRKMLVPFIFLKIFLIYHACLIKPISDIWINLFKKKVFHRTDLSTVCQNSESLKKVLLSLLFKGIFSRGRRTFFSAGTCGHIYSFWSVNTLKLKQKLTILRFFALFCFYIDTRNSETQGYYISKVTVLAFMPFQLCKTQIFSR